MGTSTSWICRKCGERFSIREGGGFFFDLLHCDRDGRERDVSHRDMGDIHFGFVKGLPGPYAVSRWRLDQQIKEQYPGPSLSREEYHAAVEASLEPCTCGGRYRYDAPARCPSCFSIAESWDVDPEMGRIFYD